MSSPFPGMNPYLEHPQVWTDFHTSFIPTLREFVNAQVIPAGYFARIEDHLYIRDAWAEEERLVAEGDLAVERRNGPPRTPSEPGGVAVTAAPLVGRIPDAIDIERIPYLEVINRAGREVVTVIELLSPTNKKGGDERRKYLAKRQELLRSDVNLVEIDLLRGWRRMPVENLPPCAYCVLVSWAESRPEVGLWPVGLRDPLPTIPIPLRPGGPQTRIDLQAALHEVYDRNSYRVIAYDTDPQPALAPDDLAWAKTLIPAAR